MEEEINSKHQEFNCTSCGGALKFVPGSTTHIDCQYCGASNEIPALAPEVSDIEELDFHAYLADKSNTVEKQELSVVKCSSCGAQSTMREGLTSDDCAFCGTPLVVTDGGATCSVIKPKSVLPFKIERKEGNELFKKWIKSLWFAPNDLVNYAKKFDKLHGMYIPYWTYDSDTTTYYTGQRGVNYSTTESYTDSEGNRKTRTVTKTRWYSVSGTVNKFFDDVLVVASNSLPRKKAMELEPWDLENLVPFQPNYLSGFQTETYQVDLEKGFDEAKEIMDDEVRRLIRRDIGGDKQRIYTVNTRHSDITFKHILLPIWLSSYRYKDKPYRFLVNGRTGEVQGERPYSWIKITLAVLAGLAVIGGFVYLGVQNGWFK